MIEGDHPPSDDMVAHVKSRLASYKAPRHVLIVDSIDRAANGKADYGRLRSMAEAAHGAIARSANATQKARHLEAPAAAAVLINILRRVVLQL